jgi:hypothetical protein
MADPVTLDEAKAFLRVTHDGEDGLITTVLAAARQRVEAELGASLSAASPAPLRLAVMMLALAAYDGRSAPDVGPWLAPYRAMRL